MKAILTIFTVSAGLALSFNFQSERPSHAEQYAFGFYNIDLSATNKNISKIKKQSDEKKAEIQCKGDVLAFGFTNINLSSPNKDISKIKKTVGTQSESHS